MLGGRPFGAAGLRLLPKAKRGVRLILNLSRRTRQQPPLPAGDAAGAGARAAGARAAGGGAGPKRGGKRQYGRAAPRSINDALRDVFLVLKYEKASRCAPSPHPLHLPHLF